MDKQNDEKKLV